ncbi:MAG: SIMPL domain-containing protein [Gammaproteobacteria bacterium]
MRINANRPLPALLSPALWLLAGAVALTVPALARSDPEADEHDEMPRTISVAGTGTVDATPDIARLTLAVQRRDASMQVARDDTVRVSKAFLALCTKLGIKENKIRTSGLTIQPEYRWDEKENKQVFTGYFVQRQLQVEINDLDKLGNVIEGAIDAGVNEVSPPQLDSSKAKELNRDALAAATADAKANAERIALSLGVRLGAVRTVVASGSNPRPPMPMQEMRVSAMAKMDSGAAANYVPGEISFENRVDATFDVVVP